MQYVYEGAGRIGDKAAQIEHAYVLHNEGDTVSCELPALQPHCCSRSACNRCCMGWNNTAGICPSC